MCVSEPTVKARSGWFKSAYSTGGDSCVEVQFDGDSVLIRDSKYRRDSANDLAAEPIIVVTAAQWHSFLDVAAGHSTDIVEPAIASEADGCTSLRSGDVTLTYTPAEWAAFTAGVLQGDFAPAQA